MCLVQGGHVRPLQTRKHSTESLEAIGRLGYGSVPLHVRPESIQPGENGSLRDRRGSVHLKGIENCSQKFGSPEMPVKIRAAEAQKKMNKSVSKTAVIDAGRLLAGHDNIAFSPLPVDLPTLYRYQSYRWCNDFRRHCLSSLC